LNIADGGEPFVAGGTGTYKITVHNSGTAASSGKVTVNIPEPFSPTSASGSGWTCTLSTALCTNPGPVPANGQLPVITVSGPVGTSPGGTIYASASVSNTSDSDPSDHSAAISTDVVAGPVDLTVDIADTGPFGRGGVGIFIITVRNVGSAASSGITTVDIPEPFSPTDAGGSGWTCDMSAAACTSPAAVAPGGSLPEIYVIGPVPSQGAPESFSGSASVSNASDDNSGNNTASITTPVVAVPPQQQLYSPLIARSTDGGGDVCFSCLMNALIHPTFGDPVDSEDGNMYTSSNDLSIPGSGYPLAFTRTYNSNAATSNGPLGYGWADNLGVNLVTSGSTSVAGSTATVTEENGAQTVFTYDGTTWDPPSEAIATLTHNSDGTWTMVRDVQQTLTFNSSGQITTITDLNGYTTTFTYSSGELTTVTDQAGRTLTLEYAGGHIASVTDPNVTPNRVVSFTYDGAGDLTAVTDVNGGTTQYTYDANHRMLTDEDPNCVATSGCPGITNQYDSTGRVTSQSDDLGRTTTFAYTGDPASAAGGSTTVTDPKGNVTVETYQYGVRVSETKGYGTAQAATTQYRYDPSSGQPTEMIDPDGNITAMAYDTSGNMLMKVDALGRLSQWTYNNLNEPLTVTDPLGVTTANAYDANGNLTSVSTPCPDCAPSGTQLTKYVYGNSSDPGDVTSMVDPASETWSYTYDAYGDKTSTTDPLGNTSTSTFNADGWLMTTVSPKGNVSGCGCAAQYTTTDSYIVPGTTSIDEFGDVQTVTDPLGHVTTYGYDADRNQTSVKDADGKVTTYIYDLDNELTQTHLADGTTTSTDYNPDGTILDQKNGEGNAIQTFGYDPLARVTSVTDALGNTTSYTYDPAGNELTKQDPGGNCAAATPTACTSYSYDADNELTGITYSGIVTPNVTGITYDADGQRTGMTDGSGTWAWTYDSLHQLTSVTEGNNGTVSYQYDMRDLVTQITYPNSSSVTRSYDAAGRWTSVTDWLGHKTTFAYDQDGNLTTETLPSATGVVDTFGFNADDQMTSTKDAKGSTSLFSATYTRDADAQLTSDTSSTGPNGPTYGYNSLNQTCYAGTTTSTQCPGGSGGANSTIYAYDSAGNLAQNGASAQSFNAADELCWTTTGTSSNTCSSAPGGATTFTYDQRGNRTLASPSTGNPIQYGYDEADRMISYTAPSGTVTTYDYNGDGLRTDKTSGGTATQFVWDTEAATPLLLDQTTGGASTYFVYGPGDLPLEQIVGSTVSWLHHDQLGSTRTITSATGAVVGQNSFTPYGGIASSSGTVSTPLLYGGQYLDSESGLYYLQARYYDPSTAQFTTLDPLQVITGQPYTYANDNPTNATDPSGDWSGVICFGLCLGYSSQYKGFSHLIIGSQLGASVSISKDNGVSASVSIALTPSITDSYGQPATIGLPEGAVQWEPGEGLSSPQFCPSIGLGHEVGVSACTPYLHNQGSSGLPGRGPSGAPVCGLWSAPSSQFLQTGGTTYQRQW
jgi:RHS repeat-associated protein